MKNDDFTIKVWAQMFFDDGSVSEGRRIPASVLEDEMGEIKQTAVKLLQSLNRMEGLLLIWGAGNIFYNYYILEQPISSCPPQALESETSACEP